MFLHLSVCLQRGSLPQCRDTPRADTPPPGADSPRAGTPREQAPPWSRHPRDRHPPQQTATVADGTHPTGMHSFYKFVSARKHASDESTLLLKSRKTSPKVLWSPPPPTERTHVFKNIPMQTEEPLQSIPFYYKIAKLSFGPCQWVLSQVRGFTGK